MPPVHTSAPLARSFYIVPLQLTLGQEVHVLALALPLLEGRTHTGRVGVDLGSVERVVPIRQGSEDEVLAVLAKQRRAGA